jgi:glucose/arabinose dehydrogenase
MDDRLENLERTEANQEDKMLHYARWLSGVGLLIASFAFTQAQSDATSTQVLVLPDGYQIEKVTEGLTYPTALAWDDQGNMYVAEAGGGLNPEQITDSRILRVTPEKNEVVAVLTPHVMASVVGMAWHDGAFYVTHRSKEDLSGAVSRVSADGKQVTTILSGIVDSKSEHQINDIQVGPDGRMYVSVGPAGNSAVVGPDIAPWVMKSPDLHTTPCQDIVLTGRNFQSKDFRPNSSQDMVLTGAYVPYGTATEPGQTIEGNTKCGGSILTFDPNDAEGSLEVHAWGFRNLIGLAWNEATGEMYAAENGYDIRGSRPVKDEIDATLRIQQGMWYGIPDFSAGREPLTSEKFEVPDEHQAMVFIGTEEQVGKDLDFVIDHEATGLTPPDPSVVVGRHPWNSSPSFLDVAPESWGEWAGHLFVAEWGDLAPPTNPLRGGEPAGFRVVRIDPATGELSPFVNNQQPGPASRQDPFGEGLERPFNVKFGPDGAMYIVDYGTVTINMALKEQGKPPYVYQMGSGRIWKVTRTR